MTWPFQQYGKFWHVTLNVTLHVLLKNFNIAPANLRNALRGPSWLCQCSSSSLLLYKKITLFVGSSPLVDDKKKKTIKDKTGRQKISIFIEGRVFPRQKLPLRLKGGFLLVKNWRFDWRAFFGARFFPMGIYMCFWFWRVFFSSSKSAISIEGHFHAR